MYDGILNVYKEKGFTSHDVVAKMRGILKIKKIGHTGTLDPDAEGVLPVCIGKATKLVDMITDKDKTYEAVLKLGITTDTQDMTGRIIKESPVRVDRQEVEAAFKCFIGEYLQLPPMYSAIKVGGKKLYELARQGKEIERERRKVIIRSIKILDYIEDCDEIKVEVNCGKGTYIRTLLHDVGEKLGCGGTMFSLLRTRVGSFTIDQAKRLSEIEGLQKSGKLGEYIVSVDQVFSSYLGVNVAREFHKLIYNGNAFKMEHVVNQAEDITMEPVRVYDSDDNFIGIYCYDTREECFRPVKMFLK